MTIDIFDMGEDIKDQSLQLIFYYWYLTLPSVLILIALWKFYPKSHNENRVHLKLYKTIPLGLLIIVLTFIGIRGGLQLRSISPKEAFIFDRYELGNLAINAAYTMVRSSGKKTLPIIKYYSSDQDAVKLITKARDFKNSKLNNPKNNVLIIIIESFSQEYVNQGYAPFFSELSRKGLYFDINFANGRRSLEALPSILAGIPSLVGKPIYQSQYQSNKFYGLPQILKDQGYSTYFFHGGKRGTMDFDAYTRSIGVDHYYGLEDYPNQSHFDGHWGVFDHHYLNYVGESLNKVQKPFVSTVFTLSSHQPYSIPKELKGRFPKGDLEIHESIGYVDYALKEFFKKIENESWFKDTLFVITADHTQKLVTKDFQNNIGRYRVPLLFYHPSQNFNSYPSQKITQHVDIMPSILDFLGVETNKKLLFGTSVFSDDRGRMLNFISGNYLYINYPNYIEFNGEEAKTYKLDESYTDYAPHMNSEGLDELKAYIQLMNNGLKHNNIYQLSNDAQAK